MDWRLVPLQHTFESDLINLAQRGQLDGAIGSFISDRWTERITQKGVQAVNLFNLSRIESIPTAGVDDEEIGRLATEHLLDQNAASLAFIARGDSLQNRLRQIGMKSRSHGAHFADIGAFASDSTILEALANMPKPVGILCSSDRVARNLIKLLRRSKLQIGSDALVIGIGDEPIESLLANTPISSFQIPASKVGFYAAKLLAEQMSDRASGESGTRPASIYLSAQLSAKESSIPRLKDRLTTKALQIAEASFSDPKFDISLLAARVGASRRALEIAMKQEYNESPHQMLSRLREKHAKELLSQTTISISEIASKCGFNEPQHFSAWFKKRVGATPRRYRSPQS